MKKIRVALFFCAALFSLLSSGQELGDAKSAFQAQKVKVFPNPATNVVHVLGLANTPKASITISDIYGNVQIEHLWEVNHNSLSIPIPNLNPGIYVITIRISGEAVQLKFHKR